ncbi:MAG: hypothetical protein ACKVS9_07680 [Phycisphaerae bacterium]
MSDRRAARVLTAICLLGILAAQAIADCCPQASGSINVEHDEPNRRLIVTASNTGTLAGSVRITINGAPSTDLGALAPGETRTFVTGTTRCGGNATALLRMSINEHGRMCGDGTTTLCPEINFEATDQVEWDTMEPVWTLSAPATVPPGSEYPITATVSGVGNLAANGNMQISIDGGANFFHYGPVAVTGGGSDTVPRQFGTHCDPREIFRLIYANGCGVTRTSDNLVVTRAPLDREWQITSAPSAVLAGGTFNLTATATGWGEVFAGGQLEASNDGVSFFNLLSVGSSGGDGSDTVPILYSAQCNPFRAYRIRYSDWCGVTQFSPVVTVNREDVQRLWFLSTTTPVLSGGQSAQFECIADGWGLNFASATLERSLNGGQSFSPVSSGISRSGDGLATVSVATGPRACPQLQLYRLRWSGYCNETLHSAPVSVLIQGSGVATQTQNDEVLVGESGQVHLVLPEVGTPVRWLKDGVEIVDGPTQHGSTIVGATTRCVRVDNAQLSDAGIYVVEFTAACGAASAAAVLIVNEPCAIDVTEAPSNRTLCGGSTAVFAVEYASESATTVVWRRNGIPIGLVGPRVSVVTNATRSELAIADVSPSDEGSFDVVIGNVCGGVTTSSPATLNVCVGCVADLNCDCAIGLSDLAALLSNFGVASGASADEGDLNGDGAVNLSDLAAQLAVFGSNCN